LLTNATNQDSTAGNPSPTTNHKPPPIFLHGVIHYGEMIKRIRDVAEDKQYRTKRLANNVIKIYSFLSTGTPTYWPTDGNKIPDILDFFVTNGISSTYTDIRSSYDLTPGHSPIIATNSTSVIVRKPTPRLHNSQTNWDIYRRIIQDKVNLTMKLKEQEDVELETNSLLSILQHAAKEATPNSNPQRTTTNIPYEIKRLTAAKRKARSIWQRTHTPDSRRIFNQLSNKLKSKLQEMRSESFKQYVYNLKRDDNSISKAIKIGENTHKHHPQ
jgi:hypothetical protein